MNPPDRRRFLTAIGTALAGVVAGCQNGGDATTPNSTAPATEAPDTSPADGAPTGTPSSDVTDRTRAFVALLDDGDYQRAHDRLSPAAAEAIPVDRLETAWRGQEERLGAYQSLSALSTSDRDGADVVTGILTYEDGRLRAIVTFGPEGIDGFQLRPLQGEWTPPEYAEKSSFSERTITLPATENCSLGATLTLPEDGENVPGVVIVHGQGAMDRDGSYGPNKMYRDMAWGLASHGVGVLRYDKRSFACEIDMAAASIDDVVTDDALTAVDHLRSVDAVSASDVVVAGHSIGGTLAPRIAARDGNLAGIVMLAALHRPAARAIVEQNEFLAKRDGTVTESERAQLEQVRRLAEQIRTLDIPDDETAYIGGDEYWRSLQEYEHDATARELTIPQLYLQGERDYQVTVEADLRAWKNAVGDMATTTFVTYDRLNHHLMPGTGTPGRAEYVRENHVGESIISELVTFASE